MELQSRLDDLHQLEAVHQTIMTDMSLSSSLTNKKDTLLVSNENEATFSSESTQDDSRSVFLRYEPSYFHWPVMTEEVVKLAMEPSDGSIDLSRTALLITDMQRDFLEKDGFAEMLGNDVSKVQRAN